MAVHPINAPHDLRPALASDAFSAHDLLSGYLAPEYHAELLRIQDELLTDLDCICDDWHIISAYLAAAGPALEDLHDLFGQLVVVTSKRNWAGRDTPPIPLSVSHLIFAPLVCLFQPGATSGSVHVLGNTRCREGHMAIIRSGEVVRTWSHPHAVSETMEGNVPWCVTCAPHVPQV